LDVPRAAVIANSIHLNNALAELGHFLAIHPRSLVKLSAERSATKVLPVKFTSQHGSVGIVTLKNRTISPVCQLFIDCVREVAKPLANRK
jgi:DNA-binding transcriptional LysR family regulator